MRRQHRLAPILRERKTKACLTPEVITNAAADGLHVVRTIGFDDDGADASLIQQFVPPAEHLHVDWAKYLLAHDERTAGLNVVRLIDVVGIAHTTPAVYIHSRRSEQH